MVKSVEFDFGCFCRNIHPLKVDNESSRLMLYVRIAVKQIGQKYLPMTVEMQRLHEKMTIWGVTTQDHMWFRRMFMEVLHYVPELRALTIWMREWGENDWHPDQGLYLGRRAKKSYIGEQAGLIARGEDGMGTKLKKLKELKLRTWAPAEEWSETRHNLADLLTIPNLQSIQINDILLSTLPTSGSITAKNLFIAATPAPHLSPYDNKDFITSFLSRCGSVEDLTIKPRTSLSRWSGTCILPLGLPLKRLCITRSCEASLRKTYDLSTLHSLEILELDWWYICHADDEYINGILYAQSLDLVAYLPRSLKRLCIVHTERADGAGDWAELSMEEAIALKTRLGALAWERNKKIAATVLMIEFRLYIKGSVYDEEEEKEAFRQVEDLFETDPRGRVGFEWYMPA